MVDENSAAPQPLNNLTRWTIWLFYAQIAVAIAMIVHHYMGFRFLSDIIEGVYETSQQQAIEDGNAIEQREIALQIVRIPVAFGGAILFLVWLFHACRNVHRLGAEDLRFTPGWAVGWCFIPVLNLWKPFQAMREIWRASADPENWTEQPVPPLLGWWWVVTLLYCTAGYAALHASSRIEYLEDFFAANAASQLSEVLIIAMTATALKIVKCIHAMQTVQIKT